MKTIVIPWPSWALEVPCKEETPIISSSNLRTSAATTILSPNVVTPSKIHRIVDRNLHPRGLWRPALGPRSKRIRKRRNPYSRWTPSACLALGS